MEPESAQNFFRWAEIEEDGNIELNCVGNTVGNYTIHTDIPEEILAHISEYEPEQALWCVGANPRPNGLTKSAKDSDIQVWKNLYLDIEPIHSARTNVSEEDKERASDLVYLLCRIFNEHGLDLPIIADSGNGFHLWQAIPSLPAQEIAPYMKAFHYWLQHQTRDIRAELDVRIDFTLSPSRQVKLYGTRKPIEGSRIATFPRVERRESTAFVDFIRTLRPQTSTNQHVESSLRCDASLAEIEEKYRLRNGNL